MAAEGLRIFTPIGMLGYGYPVDEFWRAIREELPHAIIADSGSTDSGPQKLALGTTTCSEESYVHDLEPMLEACFTERIPVYIASVGGDGSDKHVDLFLRLVMDIAERRKFHFKVACIYSNVAKAVIHEKLDQAQIHPLGPVPPLTHDEIDNAQTIVGQIGAEPYLKVLQDHPDTDIIIGGRSYDPAPYAALCLWHGIHPGIAWHMGKIMECGGLCATPKGNLMLATIYQDSFILKPLQADRKCTSLSVAAHTSYEKTRPDLLVGPGGTLDLTEATYEQVTPREVRVQGALFRPDPYTIKLEGAKIVGCRTVFFGGIRDPIMISQLNDILSAVEQYVHERIPSTDNEERIIWHVYGQNGVMGPNEPHLQDGRPSHEVGILCEVIAETQERANRVCSLARIALLHCPYPGQLATAGNFASPLTPLETSIGQVCEFNVYHLMDVSDPLSTCAIKYREVGHGTKDRKPLVGPSKISVYQSGCPKASTTDENESAHDKIDTETFSYPAKLSQLAKVIRSKNAGPFEVTFDVIFEDKSTYYHFKRSGVVTKQYVAKLYRVDVKDIITFMFFDVALLFKFTIPRSRSQGGPGELDMHCAQQHAPLLDIIVP